MLLQVPRASRADGGGWRWAPVAVIAFVTFLSMAARCRFRSPVSRWSAAAYCCRLAASRAPSSFATSFCTRWAYGNAQVSRSLTVVSRWNRASDSVTWYWVRSSSSSLLAGEQLAAPYRAIAIVSRTFFAEFAPAWIWFRAVRDSRTPPAQDCISAFMSCRNPLRSLARWLWLGLCTSATRTMPTTITAAASSSQRGVFWCGAHRFVRIGTYGGSVRVGVSTRLSSVRSSWSWWLPRCAGRSGSPRGSPA